MPTLISARAIAVLVLVTTLVVGARALAQSAPTYGAPTTTLDRAVIAWEAGDPQLARQLAREARRESPDDALTRLVATGLQIELDPHLLLSLGADQQTAAVAELDAIDAQRETVHIVGIVSGGVGLVGLFLALSLPTLLDPTCSLVCDRYDGLRFGGGLVGIGALVGAAVAIGMHADAGGWLGRWGEQRRIGVGAVSLRPSSILVHF